MRAIDLAHASGADQGDDLVGSETRPGCDGHLNSRGKCTAQILPHSLGADASTTALIRSLQPTSGGNLAARHSHVVAVNDMHDYNARREAFSGWLMEFSVLWAVFPLLDQLVENRSVDVRIMAWSVGISLTAFVFGVMLARGDTK